MAGENGNKANSASVEVEVEVEAELGNRALEYFKQKNVQQIFFKPNFYQQNWFDHRII